MTRTVRISRGHDAQGISAICPAIVLMAGEYSNPGACANGTSVRARIVLRRAGRP